MRIGKKWSFYGERGFRIGSWRAGVHGVGGYRGRASMRKEIPYHPMPCQCLGLLANDERCQRQALRCLYMAMRCQ